MNGRPSVRVQGSSEHLFGRPPGLRIPERLHPRISPQERAHGLPLHADPLAVDDAQGAQALLIGRVEVVPHEVGDLRRPEAVEVEHVGDGQLDGFVARQRAVLFVVVLIQAISLRER